MEWIKCSDRLPEKDKNILLYDSEWEELEAGYYDTDEFCNSDGKPFTGNITHWAKIEKPKDS